MRELGPQHWRRQMTTDKALELAERVLQQRKALAISVEERKEAAQALDKIYELRNNLANLAH